MLKSTLEKVVIQLTVASYYSLPQVLTRFYGWVPFTNLEYLLPRLKYPGYGVPVPGWISTNSALLKSTGLV